MRLWKLLNRLVAGRRATTRLEAMGGGESGQDPDEQVLNQLREAGADLGKPTHVLFYIYTPSEESAKRFAGAVVDRELRVEVRPAALGGGWLCLVQGHVIPTLGLLRQYRAMFNELAGAEHGEYDGWEAAVTQ